MSYRIATEILLWTNLALLIAWDVVVFRRAGVNATISRVLYDAVTAYPGLAIAIGGLLGHLFFSQSGIGK